MTIKNTAAAIQGTHYILEQGSPQFPESLMRIPNPPRCLFVVGSLDALQEGIAIVGARKATPYGLSCARKFAAQAVRHGVVVISGGARGCDAASHEAALAAGGVTVAVLGGGCDKPYPAEHRRLFQRIVDGGGAVVSEYEWEKPPLPHQFRLRNRLIAGLARATLIVEAGLPSGTFSTADEALLAGRDVLVVPGAITAASSRGANQLLLQGALPVIDEKSFEDSLFSLFGCLKLEEQKKQSKAVNNFDDPLVAALRAEPLGVDQLLIIARKCSGSADSRSWLMRKLVEGECAGLFARYPDGRWGPVVE